MADYDFKNPAFDPDEPGIDDDYSLDLPDAIMDPTRRASSRSLTRPGTISGACGVRLER